LHLCCQVHSQISSNLQEPSVLQSLEEVRAARSQTDQALEVLADKSKPADSSGSICCTKGLKLLSLGSRLAAKLVCPKSGCTRDWLQVTLLDFSTAQVSPCFH
jgi:hypothetical protein